MLEVLYIPRSLALLSLFSIHPPTFPEIPNYAMITQNMQQRRSLSESPRSPSAQPFLSVSVTDPAKMGNGVQAYISYKVITKTNLSEYEGPEKIVIRRYSDFIWLRDHLFEKYKGIFIPPLPEKSTVDGRIHWSIGGAHMAVSFSSFSKHEFEGLLLLGENPDFVQTK